MQIEIIVKSLAVRKQVTKSEKTFYWQKVGFQMTDTDFPLVFEVFLEDANPLPLGKHQMDLKFKSGAWDSLEVDIFNCKVLPPK